MNDLQGKTVLITGAARRIGAVVVKVLHQAGANIVIHYRRSGEAAEMLASDLNRLRDSSAYTVQAELCQVDTLANLIQQVIVLTGRLDILINNASSFYPTKIGSTSEQQWDDLHCSNLKAPFFLSQAAASELRKRHGCIINMVDIHALRPLKAYSVYCTAKAGLIMLTKSLAKELAPEIRVNGVAPGAILWPENEIDEETHAELVSRTALKKQGSPEDIASTILFLIRDANYITGHIIPVDGGRILNQ